MERQRKSNATASAIVEDMRAIADTQTSEVRQIASVLGIDPVGVEMQRITGLSAASLSRLGKAGSGVESRRWRHIAIVAAVARELVVLMEGATGEQDVDPRASRRWLHSGRIPTERGTLTPLEALSDDALAPRVLAELRQANG
jgi:hypothetical protein